MSFPSGQARRVSFAADALPATRAYSVSHNVPNSSGTVSRRKSSFARRHELLGLKQRAEQRKDVAKQQKPLDTRSPSSIQRFIDTNQWSRKYSNTAFTALSDTSETVDVVDCSGSGLGSQIRHGSTTTVNIAKPFSTANLSFDRSRVPSVFWPGSSRALSAAAYETNKPSASAQPSVIGFDPEPSNNKNVALNIDTLAIELDNAYFTVQAGSTISHAILLYYQGRGAEMLKDLTRTTILAQRQGNVETMARAQLWKAVILNDLGETGNMPQLLGDVLDALLQSGCGDDGDFYQISKLWLQHSDAIINYLADEYVQQYGHSLSGLDAASQKNEYQRQLAKITVLLATKFDHSEWPDPAIALNASRPEYNPHTTGLSSHLRAELQRLQGVNQALERENCDLKMDKIRYQEERRTVPHLSTAFSKDGSFPFVGHDGGSRQHATDVLDGTITPGPVSALMKQLGQGPCRQLAGSFEGTSSGPASQWLARNRAEWRRSPSFDQSPRRPRWGSSSTTRRDYGRKHSKASFSPTSPIARRRKNSSSRHRSSWGSRYPRPLQVRNTGPTSSPRKPSHRSHVPERKASSSGNSHGPLPISNSILGHKAAVSGVENQLGETLMRAMPGILDNLRTAPGSTAQRDRRQSYNPSPYTRCNLPMLPEITTKSSLQSTDSATADLSKGPWPPSTPLHHTRKQSSTPSTDALTPELLPLTDTLSPSQLEAELPELHEHQERRRRSMSLSNSSPTSPSSTSYEHERRLSQFEYQQRHGAPHQSGEFTKLQDGSQDQRVAVDPGSRLSHSTKPSDAVRRHSENASMSTASGSPVRSSSSKPTSLKSNASARDKTTGLTLGTGKAPGTPAKKSPPSSAVCMPSMPTSSTDNDDSSSSDVLIWTSFSAHAPEFTPRRPTKPDALRPQHSGEKSRLPPFRTSDHSEQDTNSYNDRPQLSHETDVAGKTSSKDIRLSLLLSQLETEQATTLDRERRMSKPVISSPLRRSSHVDEEEDDEEEGKLAKGPMPPDAACHKVSMCPDDAAFVRDGTSNAPGTVQHDEDKRKGEYVTGVEDANAADDENHRPAISKAISAKIRARSRPSSIEKVPTVSKSQAHFRGPEQAAQIEQQDKQPEKGAKALRTSEELEAVPKLADWQRFARGEDWRNSRSRFPEQMKQRATSGHAASRHNPRKVSLSGQDETESVDDRTYRGTYRNRSVAARNSGNWRRPSNALVRPRMDSRELPDIYEQRWKKLSDEIRDEVVARRANSSKKPTISHRANDGSIDEETTRAGTPDLYNSSRNDNQDSDAPVQEALGDVKELGNVTGAQAQETAGAHTDIEQDYDGSVSSMSDSEETGLPENPAKRDEAPPRVSPQPQNQLEYLASRQESHQVQDTDEPGLSDNTPRSNSVLEQVNYDEIDNSYPSPTSPRQQHVQGHSQLQGYMRDNSSAVHRRSSQQNKRLTEPDDNSITHDAPARPASSTDGSDYRNYSFSGFSGAYSPATCDQERGRALRAQQDEHDRAYQADFQDDRFYNPGSARTAGHVRQDEYLPSTTYTYEPHAPVRFQPSAWQQEKTASGQLGHARHDLHKSSEDAGANAKVPRESVWEDQRRALEQQDGGDAGTPESPCAQEAKDPDGDGDELVSPNTANISVNF